MISQSGTFYKIIVTLCSLLGVTDLSHGSPVTSSEGEAVVPPSVSHISYNQYPPSGPTGLFFTAGDIAAAESGSLFGDGALAAHPLHSLVPTGGMDMLNVGAGGNPFIRSIAALQSVQTSDDLQTAGQSYFIEPPTTSTTTQKPVFKKRRTKRPISSLAEQSKKAKAAFVEADGNNANNEAYQGNPVPYNPFRQIVNTSFGGRKRPADNIKQRPRNRANAAKKETGSAAATDAGSQKKRIDSLNEIPATTEGEPRVLGRRRPAQEIRPLRPTTTVASDDSNTNIEETPKGRRVPLRKPRPNFEGAIASSNEGADNADGNQKPLRPRLAKRPRPRPTTTIPAPTTETDGPTEITDPATVSSYQPPTSPQTAPPPPPPVAVAINDPKPRVRPARPPGVSRFANANRNTATPTPSDGDGPSVSSLPPGSFPRRRPLRPTTRQQSLTTSTEAPEDILGNLVKDEASPAPIREGGRGRPDGPQKPGREGRQGFLLRPRPTPNVGTTGSDNAGESVAQNEEGIRRPLSNRRRKRPTTTISSPVSPAISYNQNFVGGVVESNVASRVPSNERISSARRANPVLRSRVTPIPPLPVTGSGPSAYQVKEEQPVLQPVAGQPEAYGNRHTILNIQNQPNPNQYTGPTFQSFRRPTAPSAPSAVAPPPSQFHQAFVDPNNFVNVDPNFFQIPNQPNFYPGGFDNTIGVPSNFRSIQQLPGSNEFSSRSTGTSEEPEISHSDFSPAASTEKQSVSPSNAEIEAAPVSEGEDQEAKIEEAEQTTKAPPPPPPVKLSPLERFQQNRQAAARRLLAPRKPTEKTTVAPKAQNAKPGSNFRKSLIPPRMLRPRGKLPGALTQAAVPEQDKPAPNDGGENVSGETEKNLKNNEVGTVAENTNADIASAAETDKETNIIPISPNPKAEEKEASTRKPSLLEAAKRRRMPSILLKNNAAALQQPPKQITKITPTPPPTHAPETAPPTCEEGQRYSKFLKRCVTMYKPKSQG